MFEGEIFTFEVGVEKKRFIVHKVAIERHSPVLAKLMNNGAMVESTTGSAQLESTKSSTFALFAAYVYTGMYRVNGATLSSASSPSPEPIVEAIADSIPATVESFRVNCGSCGSREDYHCILSSNPADCRNHCRYSTKTVTSIDFDDGGWFPNPGKKKKKYRESPSPVTEVVPAEVPRTTVRDTFRNMRFPALNQSHDGLKQHLANLHPRDNATIEVSHHAELFIFAQEYMVEHLPDLCLHKLHRDLSALTINDTTIMEIIELMIYTYKHTSAAYVIENVSKVTDTEDGVGEEAIPELVDGIGEELRMLVKKYAVVNAKTLLDYEPFRIMLQDGGELVSDFTEGIAKRLTE